MTKKAAPRKGPVKKGPPKFTVPTPTKTKRSYA